jgi:non-specific serine/threonine protein kinase
MPAKGQGGSGTDDAGGSPNIGPVRRSREAGNLPAELSSFVGRRQEIAEVRRLLSASRLVTLTGAGGVGKTRLAQRVAAQVRRAFADGTWFVDLAELRGSEPSARGPQDPQLVADQVTATLGLRGPSTRPPMRILGEYLEPRRLLLVIDNCEHLVDPVAILADTVLRRCPQVKILATSREHLAITGEVLFMVPPLRTPDPGRREAIARLSRYESVALFTARAAAALPGFRLADHNRDHVTAICRQLEGLPLAIELAAARLRALTIGQIQDMLTDRFLLLSPGSRAALDRQQTLQACLDWSFALCTKPERTLWARLSVFTGGFELDAVEGICGDNELPADDALDLISSLIDKSILFRDDHGSVARYRMLEAIREYGQRKLRVCGDDTDLGRRHRDWHAQLLACAHAEWISPRQLYWLTRIAREHANVRAAVEFCITQPGEADTALRMAVSLPALYWATDGLLSESRAWLDCALAHDGSRNTDRLLALTVGTALAALQADHATASVKVQQARELAEELGDPTSHAMGNQASAVLGLYSGEPAQAVDDYTRALTVYRARHQLHLQLQILNPLAMACAALNDTTQAVAYLAEALTITEPRGELWHRSISLSNLATALWRQGDHRRAVEATRRSLLLKRLIGDRLGTGWCLEVLAWAAAQERDARRAATLSAPRNRCRRPWIFPRTATRPCSRFTRSGNSAPVRPSASAGSRRSSDEVAI